MTKEEALNILHNSSVYHPMYMDAFAMAIEALEQQPCPYWDYGLNTCRHANIGALATVTPIRPKGGWIVREDNTSFVSRIPRRWVECSHCGWSFSYDRIKDNFYSKCGADMRASKE